MRFLIGEDIGLIRRVPTPGEGGLMERSAPAGGGHPHRRGRDRRLRHRRFAMSAGRLVVEMMTINFSLQAYDQLVQNAAKDRYCSAAR